MTKEYSPVTQYCRQNINTMPEKINTSLYKIKAQLWAPGWQRRTLANMWKEWWMSWLKMAHELERWESERNCVLSWHLWNCPHKRVRTAIFLKNFHYFCFALPMLGSYLEIVPTGSEFGFVWFLVSKVCLFSNKGKFFLLLPSLLPPSVNSINLIFF